MKKKAVRRRVAVRCTLFSIVLLIFVFAQVQAMAAELAETVDGASQAETSQTTVKSPYTPQGNYEDLRGLEWLWALNGTYKNPPIKKVE